MRKYIKAARWLDLVIGVASVAISLYYIIEVQYFDGNSRSWVMAGLFALSAFISFLSVLFNPAERVAHALLARRARPH